MGYASQAGFRAAIADTFRFYDLEHDIVTKLNIHPFTVMDGTLRDYLKLNNEASQAKIISLINEVKAVNGRSKSLRTLIDSGKYEDIRSGIKFTGGNIGYEQNIYTFPYFCAFLLKRYLKEMSL